MKYPALNIRELRLIFTDCKYYMTPESFSFTHVTFYYKNLQAFCVAFIYGKKSREGKRNGNG